MAASSDWMPGSRQGKIDRFEQVKDWLMKDSTDKDGKKITNWARIGVSAAHFEEFLTLGTDAKNALAVVKDKSRNNDVANQEANDAFDKFTACFRKFKELYINDKRLTNPELIECGMSLADKNPSPYKDPTATIIVRIALGKNYGEVIAYIEAASGDLSARENQAPVYLAWEAVPPGSPPPLTVKEINDDHIFTRRREIVINCGIEKSGWDIYFVARIEEGNRKGEYGPIIKGKLP